MNDIPKTPEEYEQITSEEYEAITLKIIAKFKRTSPEGKRKLLATIDEVIADENDAELLEVWQEFKSILEKEGAR